MAIRPKKPVVAVIEDDPDMQVFLRLVLEGAGYEVKVAGTGEEAKAMMASQPAPSLVTMDLELPDAKGDELIMAMKTSKTWQFAPVIMITATPKSEKTTWAIRSGAKAYLQKPLKSEQVVEAVRKVLKKAAPK